MKLFIYTISLLVPLFSFGQFPEIEEQQKREILFNKVKILSVYVFDYKEKVVDTNLLFSEKYNKNGKLIERRDYNGKDTIEDKTHILNYSHKS